MNIYWEVLIITAFLAVLFHNQRKAFVITTAAVHVFVCGFRYKFMHGDLLKYYSEFSAATDYAWNSEEIIRDGRNTLFYVLNKFVADTTNGNFQVLLFIIALISIIALSIVIYHYSPMPFVSYLLWSCMGFYIFSFFSIKQTLSMAIIMIAAIQIFKGNRILFYILVLIAGMIHMPAFVFLPAYELCNFKHTQSLFGVYAFAFVVIFLEKNKLVTMMADLYYEADKYAEVSVWSIGGKTIMMIAILIAGYLLCGISEEHARKNYVLLIAATLLQVFSVYDNVFTRLADYYFQFIILYAPLMLKQVHKPPYYPSLYFNERSQKILTAGFCLLAILFYYRVNLSNQGGPESVDNLVRNFAFMWQK